ncbi:uncharacterized protein L203_100384 [Cryptococcus depauperatus CBS 7841]|uniref:Uncharacterized protein n=1 Tax=Cryptococcus depauperatus CBS 7841 TaxID=1295531 RepID=A0A1E3HY72_9TREE|nr:hypothetical protein L203_05745 [Cryptococcus depauperatus CBS 7841]
MDPRASIPQVPLYLTSIVIISPSNAPLFVHSFTGEQDQMRHYHLGHAAVDVIEERISMTSMPTKPADSYLGLLFCMEDMAFYGFQTTTKLRMVLSVALVDAMIKDSDIVAIFRAIHHIILTASQNPFLSLPPSFHAHSADSSKEDPRRKLNTQVATSKMFLSGPEDLKPEWFKKSKAFNDGIKAIGEMLKGGR